MLRVLNKLFGGTVSPEVIQREEQYTTVQRNSPHTAIIQEIHAAFNNSALESFKEAQRIIDTTPEIDDKLKTLESLGFTAVKGLTDARSSQDKLIKAKAEANRILYFQQTYPQYKYITAPQIKSICDKYGLAWGNVSKYIGEVPSKNVGEILKFKQNNPVKPEDWRYHKTYIGAMSYDIIEITKSEYDSYRGTNPSYRVRVEHTTSFDICAPIKDMNLDRSEKVNGRYQDIPDPVVLFPVRGGYLIISAWGDEASDELVVNQKLN